jgi:hypothetical protein
MAMTRKATTFLIFTLFLWAQVAFVLHSAEHGTADHTHDGKQCEFMLSAKSSNADVPPTQHTIILPVELASYTAPCGYRIPVCEALGEHPTRAPPSLS